MVSRHAHITDTDDTKDSPFCTSHTCSSRGATAHPDMWAHTQGSPQFHRTVGIVPPSLFWQRLAVEAARSAPEGTARLLAAEEARMVTIFVPSGCWKRDYLLEVEG